MSEATRVISLLPSVTETLRAWGHDPIACTRFCEQPDLPAVGGTKDPDLAAIIALRPELVVMDEEENRREDAEALAAAGVELFVTAVRSVDEVGPTLRDLADAVGFDQLHLAPDAGAPAQLRGARRGFVPIWRNPWMTISAATYGSSLLEALGVANVFAGHPDRYPTLDGLGGIDADLVVAPSEPYPFTERQRPELEAVAPVTFVDGRDLFWWGVRTPAARERLSRGLDLPR
ncbi:MAG TPA: helical backbone metal receptor [Acidimicrobiales bacterium]|nr:helical backbone metal receptor [Acidimicrobiales bacterium]